MEALRRAPARDQSRDSGEIPPEILDRLQVAREDFVNAMKRVQPSALREIMIQVPDVSWDDVGGLDEAKRAAARGHRAAAEAPARRSSGSASAPPRGSCCSARPAPARRCWPRRSRARRRRTSSPPSRRTCSPSGTASPSSRSRGCSSGRGRWRRPSSSSTRSIRWRPQRGGGLGEPAVTERVVNTLLAEMDGLEELQRRGGDRRHQPADPARPGAAAPRPLRRAGLRAGARAGWAAAHPADPHRPGCRWPTTSTSRSSRTARAGYTGADLEDLARRAGLQALRDDLEVRADHHEVLPAGAQGDARVGHGGDGEGVPRAGRRPSSPRARAAPSAFGFSVSETPPPRLPVGPPAQAAARHDG